jgi:uncharacterized damage-inducible protein DinB
MVRIETVLDSWKAIRQDTAQTVADFPPAELDFRPVPEVASFREIARHILDSGHALAGLLLANVDDFATPEFRRQMREHSYGLPENAGAPEIAAALNTSFGTRRAELCARTPDFFAGLITRFDGQRVTRLEMIQMIKEHEIAHRSQLFLYLRLKGIVPVTTRRRQART